HHNLSVLFNAAPPSQLYPLSLHDALPIFAAGYSVGSEFRRRNGREWLASAGGDPVAALAGKLAPLFCIFVVIMLAVTLVLEGARSEEHTSELQSRENLVCRLLLEKKKNKQ